VTLSQFILALTLYREASGASHDARVAIRKTIENRAAKGGWWGSDILSVCLKPYQFSSMTAPRDPNLVRWPTANDSVWADCAAIAQGTFDYDPTDGATYYWTAPLTEAPTKEWGAVTETAVVDGIHFCKPSVV